MNRRVLATVTWLSFLSFAIAGPTGPGASPPHGPSGAPSGADHYVYMNQDGYFDLDSTSASAVYNWSDGHGYKDSLTFYGQMALPLYPGTPNAPAYVYQASGNGNTWWLAFGVQPFDTNCTGENVYPLWYSFVNPSNPNTFIRWTTPTGTKRVKIAP